MEKLIEQILEGEVFWYEASASASALTNNQTAFSPYSNQPRYPSNSPHTANSDGIPLNMNKRVIEFLRKSRPVSAGGGEDRCFRHMMNERVRREKQKTSYAALHSLLPAGTKRHKNSIVESAVQSMKELQLVKAELEKQSRELEFNLAGKAPEATKLKIRVPNPASGIDSFVAVLKCLMNSGSETRAVQAELADHEFVATMYVETTHKSGVPEMESAVERALQEAELKLPSPSSTTATGLITRK